MTLEQIKINAVKDTLVKFNFNQSKAAEELGITRLTLRNILGGTKKLQVMKQHFFKHRFTRGYYDAAF